MTPRRYDMRTRSAAVEQTRQRIVMAAIRLFSEQTATATSMEDVATAAGVSPATVYRHFGDFDGLADACAQTAFFIAEIPTPQQAVQQFADQPDLLGKLDRFIAISCHCYEQAADWLAAERRERHLPAFARTLGREEAALDAIVRGLLEPAGAKSSTVAVVKTLVDFPFWESLVSAGVEPGAIPTVMNQLVLDQLARAGVPTDAETVGGTHDPTRARSPRTSPRSR